MPPSQVRHWVFHTLCKTKISHESALFGVKLSLKRTDDGVVGRQEPYLAVMDGTVVSVIKLDNHQVLRLGVLDYLSHRSGEQVVVLFAPIGHHPRSNRQIPHAARRNLKNLPRENLQSFSWKLAKYLNNSSSLFAVWLILSLIGCQYFNNQ